MTETKFTPDEILRLAVKIKVNGSNFYRNAVSFYKNKEFKSLFSTLSSEEDKHKDVFQDILNNFKNKDYLDAYSSEHQKYINSIANDIIFTQANISKKIKEGFKSIDDVFSFALGIEEDSILFYTELKSSILKGEDLLSGVINEERRHFSLISDLKAKYLNKELKEHRRY
ncbi:MAG: ferritin family protein [Candidatus Kaelpia aquatica]|nr:ferritin family protein [Candidatus Kaelpia aquatica]